MRSRSRSIKSDKLKTHNKKSSDEHSEYHTLKAIVMIVTRTIMLMLQLMIRCSSSPSSS